MGMTLKQEKFYRVYIMNGNNATQAALKAGYSKKTAYSIGQELLKKPEIQEKIQNYLRKKDKLLDFWREKVLNELSIVAFSDITHYATVKKGKVEIKAINEKSGLSGAIASLKSKETKYGVNYSVRLWDKVKALEAMAKLLGTEKQPTENADGETFDRFVDILANRYKKGD